MSFDLAKLDEQINLLRDGNTLTENEVKALCDKVRHNGIFVVIDPLNVFQGPGTAVW